jgi:class 3 adenylate cyclase/tetratricopeptide (TPR) repeat protein
MIVCPSCGQENPEGFRLCGMCGTPLAEAPAREERKVVTVLFADLVGFTSQAEKLDPEEVRALLQPYHARLREILERHGGTVEKFIGDAVMAVFGAPVAHEDDPERAVRAALAIKEALADTDLHVRVGVTTGEALVALGARPEAGEGMASGDVVNTGARLQTAAPVDGILVDETTYRATERAIEYHRREPILAKGKAEPVPVWEAVEARARFGTDVRQIGRAPLVGRENELDALLNALARARDGEPQLVTLVGVPGIGKSRLVWELFQRVDASPEFVTWRQGRSLPYGEGISFWALGEMVKAHAGILETDQPAEAERKMREIAGDPWVESHLRPLVGLEADAELGGDRRAEAFAAWRRFFEALAEQGLVVLVFEDLHWADDGLLDFVDHLVEWASGVSLLVVGTARPELLARRPGWGGGKANATTLSLAPLDDEETARLVHALLGRSVLEAQTQSTLLERAGGNPLYAEEFVRLVEDRRGDVALPESVQGIIAARLDSLPPEEKGLLQDAAVLGKVFWLGALGRERWVLEERLHALERKEFVRRERRSSVAGETEYAFRHALVRDVAYEQIPRAERGDRHLRSAEWIESLGRPEDHAEMLAHHYLAALEYGRAHERAGPALREAGDRAFALNAFPQAARFYDRALDLAPDPELTFRHAHALYLSGAEGAAEALERASLEAGNRERAAEANALLAELWWHRGSQERSLAYQERAAELIEEAPPSAAKARVLAEVSRFRVLAEESEEGLALAREAYAMADELGLTELAARSLNNIGIAKNGLGDHHGGLADVERSIELALSVNSPEAARGYNNLGAILSDLGETTRSEEAFEEAVRTGERLGNAVVARYARAQLVGHTLWRGNWDETLRLADAFIAECEAGSPHYSEPHIRLWRAQILLARGESEERILDDTTKGLAKAREAKDPQVVVPTLQDAADIFARLGRPREARALLAEMVAAEAQSGFLAARPGFLLTGAFVAKELGMVDELRPIVEGAAESPWRDTLGALLDEDYERVADFFDARGSSTPAAEARLRAAQKLVAEGRRAEADVHLQKALAFYRSVGATRNVREAESLLAAAG